MQNAILLPHGFSGAPATTLVRKGFSDLHCRGMGLAYIRQQAATVNTGHGPAFRASLQCLSSSPTSSWRVPAALTIFAIDQTYAKQD